MHMRRPIFALVVLAAILEVIHLYLALIWSPAEKHMGDLVRIMYFHVASAWVAFCAFFTAFAASILYLVRPRELSDAVAASAAEIGLLFTTVALITGSLWAKPVWNVWWTWDPRLTTTLILWFLYVGYLLLRGTIEGPERRARIAAVYALVAFVDVPIIHLSVTWWRSIHPQVVDTSGFHMPPSMMFTLLFGFVSFLSIYALLLLVRTEQHRMALATFRLRQRLQDARDV